MDLIKAVLESEYASKLNLRPLAPVLNVGQAAFDGYGYCYVAEACGCLLMFFPYVPHCVPETGTAYVDRYYYASQSVYRAKSALLSFARGFFPEADTYMGSYKALVRRAGIGACLYNSLIYIKPFGTFFCMEVIDLKNREAAFYPEALIEEPRDTDECLICGRCSKSCPAGALLPGKPASERFVRENCIRQKQFEDASPRDPSNVIRGNRLLGCTECQLVCPLNAGVAAKMTRPPAEYYEMFDLDTLARACVTPGFKKSRYAEVFGYNYMKPRRILGHVLAAMVNDGFEKHRAVVEECLKKGNPAFRDVLEAFLGNAER
ncbi:MAG: 4Fe-4S binding protein [Clostridia bacterium]|nr:4Fe-4S binding protein [Clostridia bacterium]